MNIKTKYMGLNLPGPVIVGSSSLTNSIDNMKKAEDAGAGAIVIKSLFEEQILTDSGRDISSRKLHSWYPEAVKGISNYSENQLIDHYLKLIEFGKTSLNIPILASINCISDYEWPQFASSFEEAGANAIELNISVSPADSSSGDEILLNIAKIISAVRDHCTIPVSVKLSPFFTNFNTALKQIDETGIEGLVLFNRLFTPNIDIESISVTGESNLSSTSDMNTSLRWISLLSDSLKADIAGSGGVHDSEGAIKYLLAGARAVQVTSAIMMNGFDYIGIINNGISKWMDEKGYTSIDEFCGLIAKDISSKNQFLKIQYLRFE
ncbi:MAG: dihydroorotate dehydrogenase-like protein [Candidatus Kapabacteria bacterium]|nr:dihydroorotate dehydrogenase-like protein [Ignavibacteriota bacterium]MCW5885761.1 dihydroorotate dehydrogenase-like protein [Candidatus Kapabacteria bacterium]